MKLSLSAEAKKKGYKSVAQMAKVVGCPPSTLYKWFYKYGIDKAMNMKSSLPKRNTPGTVSYEVRQSGFKSIKEAAEKAGCSERLFYYRVKHHGFDKALSMGRPIENVKGKPPQFVIYKNKKRTTTEIFKAFEINGVSLVSKKSVYRYINKYSQKSPEEGMLIIDNAFEKLMELAHKNYKNIAA